MTVNLTPYAPIVNNSQATTGLFNSRFQALQSNISAVNNAIGGVPLYWAGGTNTINAGYLYFATDPINGASRTNVQIINAAVNDPTFGAVHLGATAIWLPANLVSGGYDITQISPALPADIRMVREGQGSFEEYDGRAYGADNTGGMVATAGLQAAANAIFNRSSGQGGTLALTEGTYITDKPIICRSGGMVFKGPGQGMFAKQHPALIGPNFYGPAVVSDNAATPHGMTTALVGTGQAWHATDDNYWFNLRDAKTLDIHGATALTISCYHNPDDAGAQRIIVGSSGKFRFSETLHQAFLFGLSAGAPYVQLNLTSGVKTVTAGTTTIGATTYLEADWDGSNLYLFQGVPGGTASLLGSVAATGTLIQNVAEEVTHGPTMAFPEQTIQNNGPRGITDGLHISNIARNVAAGFSIPNAKPVADSHTLMLMNHASTVGGCTQASTKDLTAWLWQRSPLAQGGEGFEFYGIDIVGQSTDNAIGICIAANALTWKVSRSTMTSMRTGIISPRLESFYWRIEDIYMSGTTGRYGIQSGGGLGLLENIVTLGFQVPIYLSINGTCLNQVFVSTQTNTVYGMVLLELGTSGAPYSAQNVNVSTESGAGSGFLAPLVFSGSGTARGASWHGGALETGNNAFFILADTIESLGFYETHFLITGSPTAIMSASGTFANPVVFHNCRADGGTIPWTDTPGTAVVTTSLTLDQVRVSKGTSGIEAWYPPAGVLPSTISSSQFGQNILVAYPYFSGVGGALDRIMFRITVAGGAGSKARVGIYNNDPLLNLPTSLVVDGGEYDATVTGTKITTITSILLPNTWYWLVFINGGNVAFPTAAGYAGAQIIGSVFGVSNALDGTMQVGWFVTQAYGALPATFPASPSILNASGTVVGIHVRYK